MLEPLDELERDIAGELINVGVGLAADGLSQMLDEEVVLATPSVECVRWSGLADRMGLAEDPLQRGVQQRFQGGLDGDALLLFPEDQGERLVAGMLRSKLSGDCSAEMIDEALLEVGNVILGATLSSFCDGLSLELEAGLPQQLAWRELLGRSAEGAEAGYLILISLGFEVPGREVKGTVSFALDLESGDRLRAAIARHVESLGI